MKIRNFIFKKIPGLLAIILILQSSLFSFIPSFLSPKTVNAAASCSASGMPNGNTSVGVGGVALDQAATFLADMTDYKGAYYDSALDRIVFVGKTDANVPKFDKDDLAVAIKTIFFENLIPTVSLETKPGDTNLTQPVDVVFDGSLEDTKFGQVLLDADYVFKQYTQGYDTNGNPISSSVSSYKSLINRLIEASNGTPIQNSSSRYVLKPDLVTLKKDDQSNSFVFDQVKMKAVTEPLSQNNDPLWNQKSQEFVQDITTNYDNYAAEIPSFYKTKQLAKIVAVVKWIKDSNIATDFEWARDYQPAFNATPREMPRLAHTYQIGNASYTMSGGVTYFTGNTYNNDDGTALGIKNASQAQSTQKEDVHWTFNYNNTQYQAVAVEANAFKNLGAYSTSVTDLSTPISDDINLSLDRTYSSFASNNQKGIGLGWNMIPAKLTDTHPGWGFTCAETGRSYGWKFSLRTPEGYESFTKVVVCSDEYAPDDPAYNTRLFQNADGTFIARLKNQSEYKFDSYINNYRVLELKDKNGNKVTYNYDGQGRLSSLTDSSNHTLNISYNGQNLVSGVSDWANRTVSYTYDGTNRLSTVTDPKGGVITYTYDTSNRLATVKNRLNQIILTNTYNSDGKLATQKDAANITTTFSYNYITNTLSSSDTNSRSGSIIYDNKARITKQNDAANNFTEFTYGDEYSPLTVKDKRGVTTTYTYDTAANLKSITNSEGLKSEFSYDSKNNLTLEKDYRYSLGLGSPKQTLYIYDSNGNLLHEGDGFRTIHYTYNNKGQILTYVNALNKTTTYTRDSFNNPLTVTDPNNKVTTNTYDNVGRLTQSVDPDNKTLSFTYDKNNNLLTKTDSLGTVTNIYNGENKLTKTTFPDNSVYDYTYNSSQFLTSVKDPLNNLTSYGYDAYQNLTSKEDTLNHVTEYSYNQLNFRTQSETPLGKATSWEYDPNGNITKRIDASNQTTTYEYDTLNRLKKINYPNATNITYTYDKRGNLLTSVDQSGTTSYSYDIEDRLAGVTDPNNNTVSYQYDAEGNNTKITYPGNREVNYTYDNANRLATVTSWNNETTTYNYNNNGLLNTKNLPNGIVTTYNYDNANRLSSIAHKKGATTLAQFSYARDSLGRITAATESGTFSAKPPQLSDDWSSGAINNTKWNNWGSSHVNVVNNQLVLSSTTGSGYYGIDSDVSSASFNATNSTLTNQVVSAGNQSITSWDVYPLLIQKEGDTSYQLSFTISNNTIIARKVLAGTSSNIYSATYNPTNHKYLRIRESAGTTYWETSADGNNWTNFTSLLTP